MKQQVRSIQLSIHGKFYPKGKIEMERKITDWMMARIIQVVAEEEAKLEAEALYQREVKKQSNITENIEYLSN